jgi:O-antigen ligase
VVVVLLFQSLRGDRLGTYFLNLIHFGNLALIVGLVAGLSINWDRKDRAVVIALKILALLAGVWISIASGTRGGWIAIPAIALVWALLQRRHISQRLMALATVVLVAAILIIYALAAPVHERINALAFELRAFEQLKDTSTGLRIQIWAAALHLFAQYPIFGVGPDRFAEHIPALAHAGYLTPTAMEFGRAEVHNEILNRAVTLGVFGLASILLIYLVPFILFLRAARAPSKVHRTAALLGACFVTGFFVFGLTVEIFNLKTTATFYSLTVAVLLAIATNRAETS